MRRARPNWLVVTMAQALTRDGFDLTRGRAVGPEREREGEDPLLERAETVKSDGPPPLASPLRWQPERALQPVTRL